MENRPGIGATGRALTELSPEGQVEVGGTTFSARAAESIAAGQDVLITGYEPQALLVRAATAEEVAQAAAPRPKPRLPTFYLVQTLYCLAAIHALLAILGTAAQVPTTPIAGAVGLFRDLIFGLSGAAILYALGEILRMLDEQATRSARRDPNRR